MNEEELKEIWKKDESFTIENLDFERISQLASKTQKNLQNKIKWEITANILLYILIAPFFFYFPKLFIILPFMIVIWIWYLWENLRIYKFDFTFQKYENVKIFLAEKEKLLANYLRRTRVFGYLGMPFVFLVCYIGMTSLESVWKYPLNFFGSLLFAEILILVFLEVYIRKIYQPVLDELRDLLQQLND